MLDMLRGLGTGCARHPVVTIIIWIVLLAMVWGLGLALGGKSDNDYSLPGAPSQAALDTLQTNLPEASGASATVVIQGSDGQQLSDPGVKSEINALTAQLGNLADVEFVTDPYTSPGAISANGRAAQFNVQYTKSLQALPGNGSDSFEALRSAVEAHDSAGLQIELGGTLPGAQQIELNPMLVIYGLIAALIVLLLALGTWWAFAWPVVGALIGVATGAGIVQVMMSFMSIPSLSGTVAMMIGLGVGIDYGLFVTARVKEEIEDGRGKLDAAGIAVATAGRAAITAGSTVIVALLALLVFGVPAVNDMAYTIAVTVIAVVLAAVTLVPAILALLGKRIAAGRLRFQTQAPLTDRLGPKWSALMIRWRWPAAILTVGALVLLMLPVLTGSMRLGPIDNGLWPTDSTQYRAQQIQTEQFGPGYPDPFLMVAELPEGDDKAQAQLDSIVSQLKKVPGVAAVNPPTYDATQSMAAFALVPATGPQDAATPDLVRSLRDETLPQLTQGTNIDVLVSGLNAVFVDLDDRISQRLVIFIALVIAIALLILGAVFRSVLVPVTAAIFNVLVIYATYGVLVMVFTWGWGLSLLGVPSTMAIISLLAPVIFAVIFGLSNDYEVYLVSRMKERYQQTGDARDAIRYGHGTGIRIVIAAALIMWFVFASYGIQPGAVIKQAGFGMATAILIDAFLVRMILLPATLAILGRSTWWFFGRYPKVEPPVDGQVRAARAGSDEQGRN